VAPSASSMLSNNPFPPPSRWLVPPLPYTATSFAGVLSTIDCRLLFLRRDTLPYSVSRARATSSSFSSPAHPHRVRPLYRRQQPCATRFSILASCDRKLRPFALFYTTGSRINKFSGNITAEKFINMYLSIESLRLKFLEHDKRLIT